MNNKRFFRRAVGVLLGLALVLILSLSLSSGGSFAKYSKSIVFSGEVTYTPIPSVIVMADVSVAPCNDVILVPGAEITSTTSVTVTWQEDAVPAYLYLELSGDHASQITSLGTDWTKLDATGNVFVYHGGTALTEQPADIPVQASFTADTVPTTENETLQFKAYLIQQLDGVNAADAFADKSVSDAVVKTDTAFQNFVPADASCTLSTTDYTVTNNGNIPVYVRAFAYPVWKNDAGDVLSEIPDVELVYEDNWQDNNGILYYKGVLPAGETTEPIFTAPASVPDSPEEGYTLQYDVDVDVIQADPDAAVQDAWGMIYSDGTWTMVP